MKKLTEKERLLIDRTREFADDNIRYSTKCVVEAHAFFILCSILSVFVENVVLKLIFSGLAGLLLLRCFVLYHDFLHGSILREQRWAEVWFRVFSVVYVTPKSVWKETHGYHHTHNSKIPSTHIGSYKLVTKTTWAKMSGPEKALYKWIRHPLNMVVGIFTVFFVGMVITPLLRSFEKNKDAALVLGMYLLLVVGVIYFLGFGVYFYAILLPQVVASAIGSYLFFVQHNFPTAHIQPLNEWSFAEAALHSSSFMTMHPVMHWFSANIGYHHIHHLNPKIPFYRLPEAMEAIPELAPQHITSFSWKDVKACFAVKLWDEKNKTMVGYN